MDDSNQFFLAVRGALNHLYDPEYLARSPLIELFGVAARYDPASALQQSLIKAIESLRPRRGDLLAPRDQQAHDLLLFRYVQRLTQDEIAHQFGISQRQLRRDQNRAVQLLAGRLWEQYGLDKEGAAHVPGPGESKAEPASSESFAWLVQNPQERLTDPNQALVTIIELGQTLAQRHAVRLAWSAPAGLPPLAVHPIAFRQILIAQLSHAIQCATGGHCSLHVCAEGENLTFEVAAHWLDAGQPPPAADFDQVEELVALFHGRLVKSQGQTWVKLHLSLPVCEQWTVLAIDDNPDILQLLQRYVAGTRYQVIAAQEASQAFEVLETQTPRVIILDVMMPRMDGWELLRKLRNHPIAGRLPIVVCTILNQPELSYALGANAFLRKPVTQAELLATLERLTGQEATGFR
ncbi:MAG: response regulator [Chloroflexi bacterium]|nr:response regulator [Chloroflexota bacterium]